MKRLILFMVLLFIGLGIISCNSNKQKKEIKPDTVGLVVENTISTDREYMYLHAGKNYRWFETQVTLKNYLDEDSTSSDVEKIVSIFQTINEVDTCSFDTYVYSFTHEGGKTEIVCVKDFWIEDLILDDQKINLTFKDAYNRFMMADCPKPHSRFCTLRRQLGPIPANPQYIFGNIKEQVFVDATTGDVSTVNPAFGFSRPLGEWP